MSEEERNWRPLVCGGGREFVAVCGCCFAFLKDQQRCGRCHNVGR